MRLEILVVGAFGFLGAVARFFVYLWYGNKDAASFPWATLTVNVLGCLLIGIIGGLVERQVPNHRLIYLSGSVGFLGAFTTFSAFGFETLNLLRNQEITLAFANVGANMVLGLLAVWLGRILILPG